MPGVRHKGPPSEELGRWLKRLDARVSMLESPYRLAKVSAYNDPTGTYSSSSWGTISGMPSLTATMGPEEDCIITVGSYIGIGANATGLIGLVVDGVQINSNEIVGLSNSNVAGIAANVQSSRLFSSWFGESLEQGDHTFSLVFQSTSGTANFSSTFLSIEHI